jgi:Dolichyl-phosphate-mannose-protein mannosyltransferase
MNRRTDVLLVAIAMAFGIYVLNRAWLIPITVDECSTAVSHVPRSAFDTLFYQSDANPNNHILNTLLIKAFTGMFGWHPFVVRIPALFGALLYAFAGLMLSRKISQYAWIGVFTYLMLLCQPYMLEFFSLARGYALGLGLLLTAMWQAWRFLKEEQWSSLIWAIIPAGLAVYANFTLVLFLIPFIGLLIITAWQRSVSFLNFLQKTKFALLALGTWAGFIFTPLKRVSSHSEVQNWNRLDTLFGSAERSLTLAIAQNPYLDKSNAPLLAMLAIFFTIGIGFVAANRWLDKRMTIDRDSQLFIVLVLWGTLATNVLQVAATHTPYLEPRLALLYWPLFALSTGVAAAWIYEHFAQRAWVFMAPLGIFAILNTANCLNLNEASEWWNDRDTYVILDYLRNLQKLEGRQEPFSFDTDGAMQNSFIFHTTLDPRGFDKIIKIPEWHPDRTATDAFEFYYASSQEDANPIMATYEIVLKPPESGRLLLRKKKQVIQA